jgi:hypothetical protein
MKNPLFAMKPPARDCPPPCEDALVTLLVRVPPARIGLVWRSSRPMKESRSSARATRRWAARTLGDAGAAGHAEGALDDLRRRFRIDFLEERPGHPSLASSPKLTHPCSVLRIPLPPRLHRQRQRRLDAARYGFAAAGAVVWAWWAVAVVIGLIIIAFTPYTHNLDDIKVTLLHVGGGGLLCLFCCSGCGGMWNCRRAKSCCHGRWFVVMIVTTLLHQLGWFPTPTASSGSAGS